MLRKLVLAAMGSALLLGVFSVPASAASDAEVLEVNGIPGTKIEICSGGKEHANLGYGRAIDWEPAAGALQKWSIRKAVAGTCKGRKLKRFEYTFDADTSYTVVYWKVKSNIRMSVFKNELGISDMANATMRVRHTARAGTSEVWAWQKVPTVAVADDGATVKRLKRNTSSPVIEVPPHDTLVALFPLRAVQRWRSADGGKKLLPGRAYQAIFMGDKQSNMKVKLFALPGHAK